MSQGANIRSLDAIRDFKIALITFAEEAGNALGGVEMEIRQTRNWLQRDQLTYWQSQVKRGQERVSMARTELHRRQLMQSNSDAISDTEQKEALRDAQRKLREAEEKVITIKKWLPVLDHAISEYHSQAQPLGDRLSGSFVATLNLLDRMIGAIDSYLATAPPTAPVAPRRRAVHDEAESTYTSGSGGESRGAPAEDDKKPETAAASAPSQVGETAEYPTASGSSSQPERVPEPDPTAEFGNRPL